jgi:hypothetical protein
MTVIIMMTIDMIVIRASCVAITIDRSLGQCQARIATAVPRTPLLPFPGVFDPEFTNRANTIER